MASAFPFLIVFPLLAWAGFNPAVAKAGGAIDPQGLAALKMLGVYGAAPVQIIGALLYAAFPINKAEAVRIGSALAEMRGQADAR